MNEEQINQDRQTRLDACKKEIDAALLKYEFGLVAEDNWGSLTKIRVGLSFIDQKKYESPLAQEPERVISEKVISDMIAEDNEPLNQGAEVVDSSKIKDAETKETK